MLVVPVAPVDVMSYSAFVVYAVINGSIFGVSTYVLLHARRVA